jgi:predicted nucleic acid-binding protein
MKPIMIDTSIWIDYFRGDFRDTELIEHGLNQGFVYITGPILAELLQGVKTAKEYTILSRCISAVPFVECAFKEWLKAGKISLGLRKKGLTIPLTDIIISVAAAKIGAVIYTRDSYFKKIPGVELYSN